MEEEAYDVPLYAVIYFSGDAMRGGPTKLVTLLTNKKISGIGLVAREMANILNRLPSDATKGRYISVFPLFRTVGSGNGDVGINGVYTDELAGGNDFVFGN